MHVVYNLKINKGKIWIETKQNIVKSKIKKVQNWKRKKIIEQTNKKTEIKTIVHRLSCTEDKFMKSSYDQGIKNTTK